METGLGRDVIELIVVIEFVLIIFLIFSTYFAKLSATLLAKRKQKIISEIENYFKKIMDTGAKINLKSFKRRWRKIQLLFPTMLKFDSLYASNSAWLSLKNDFLHSILLPLARRRVRSRRWLLRFYASETFSLIYEPQDEPLLLRLLRDRIPLVYLHSINTAIKSESEAAINAVINRMSKMSWLTQSMHLIPFENATPKVRGMIENRLKSAKETNIRAECYQILTKIPPASIDWDMTPDLNSIHFELRLAALKFLLHCDEQKALPLLVDKLKDDHWEVRLVALHRLGKFKMQSAIASIAQCLSDSDWRVKMGAAEALCQMGKEGKAILQERAPELANISFDE